MITALLLAGLCAAQDAVPALQTAMGTVDKASKKSVTIRPRGPDGRFAKSVTLEITGTSKITTLAQQKRGGKPYVVQRETNPEDLQSGQGIAVIYTASSTNPVLLSAVVQSTGEK